MHGGSWKRSRISCFSSPHDVPDNPILRISVGIRKKDWKSMKRIFLKPMRTGKTTVKALPASDCTRMRNLNGIVCRRSAKRLHIRRLFRSIRVSTGRSHSTNRLPRSGSGSADKSYCLKMNLTLCSARRSSANHSAAIKKNDPFPRSVPC